ncbi:MAG: molybdopterin-guanine dinucleotide biosynthesis protein B [Candidatus Eisenbacteria bacterium]
MKALQVVGRKKSGKTSLTLRLIPLLQGRGLRVGTVKHSSHPHPLDREGSDSWLHRKAGAEATLAISAAAATLHFDLPETEEAIQRLVEERLGHLDLVLIEGWSNRQGPKIEVLPADKEGRPREPRFLGSGDLIAAVLAPGLRPAPDALAPWKLELRSLGDSASSELRFSPDHCPAFHWEDLQALTEWILSWHRTN